ncbi:hypothetical protein EWE75_19895 [Sphingomonas populi]|uniref:Uncharacterized protein n=1 Tax=Sphingomonas populi TaxID=2484750 RepID=A0A4Q6XVS3_9SPHN|nr:hypothetical protein [Sphingomonas populi]RZF61029.1 hypothetical protein EWE75_19895 [Sphingomonas populi]
MAVKSGQADRPIPTNDRHFPLRLANVGAVFEDLNSSREACSLQGASMAAIPNRVIETCGSALGTEKSATEYLGWVNWRMESRGTKQSFRAESESVSFERKLPLACRTDTT